MRRRELQHAAAEFQQRAVLPAAKHLCRSRLDGSRRLGGSDLPQSGVLEQRTVCADRRETDSVHEVAGANLRGRRGVDLQRANRVAQVDDLIPREHHNPAKPHSTAGTIRGGEVEEPVHGGDRQLERIGHRRHVDRNLVDRRDEELHADDLPVVVEPGTDHGLHPDDGVDAEASGHCLAVDRRDEPGDSLP